MLFISRTCWGPSISENRCTQTLALAAERTAVLPHAACFISNHRRERI
jgi:hypothetical protein